MRLDMRRGPCPLVTAWLRRLSLAQRTRAELDSLTDVTIGLSRCQISAVGNGTFSR
jgi:uncharacterized protein YjiS (DUF1127 family)